MNRRTWILFAVALMTAGISYAVTRAARSSPTVPPVDPATHALMNWLDVAAEQHRELYDRDPAFGSDLNKLREDLRAARMALASALEDSTASDELITGRVEKVIAASNAMERRVTQYLLNVRRQLTPEQRRQLFSLCAQGVREGPGWRCRFGQGNAGEGMGPQGMGMGRGRMQGPMGPRRGMP